MALQRWQGNSHTGCNKVVCYRHAPSAKALVLCVQPKLPSFRPWTDGRNNVVIMVGCFIGHWHVKQIAANKYLLSQQTLPEMSSLCHPRLHICQVSFWRIQSLPVVSFKAKHTLLVPLLPEDISHLLSLFRWAGSSKFPISSPVSPRLPPPPRFFWIKATWVRPAFSDFLFTRWHFYQMGFRVIYLVCSPAIFLHDCGQTHPVLNLKRPAT